MPAGPRSNPAEFSPSASKWTVVLSPPSSHLGRMWTFLESRIEQGMTQLLRLRWLDSIHRTDCCHLDLINVRVGPRLTRTIIKQGSPGPPHAEIDPYGLPGGGRQKPTSLKGRIGSINISPPPRRLGRDCPPGKRAWSGLTLTARRGAFRMGNAGYAVNRLRGAVAPRHGPRGHCHPDGGGKEDHARAWPNAPRARPRGFPPGGLEGAITTAKGFWLGVSGSNGVSRFR